MLKMKHVITFITIKGEKMRKKYKSRCWKRSIIFIILFIFSIFLVGLSCNAQDLADTYAPIFYFEGEETCYPIDVDFQIQNSYLYEVGNSIPVSQNPTSLELSSYSSDIYQMFYLDNQRGSIDNYNQIIRDSENWESINGNVVYYYIYYDVATDSNVIQYWMFYAFNKGELNQHEGDWEIVQVLIDDNGPSWVAYSQHHFGQKASWSQVEKDGNHFRVYVARGSHANYLRSYSGKFGIASDIVGANGKILSPNDYSLKNLEDNDTIWREFRGRWGEVADTEASAIEASILGQAGPEGPKFREEKEIWNNPVGWGGSLFESNEMIFTLEWVLYNFVLIFALISLIIIALLAYRIYRNHIKYGLGPRIVSMLYINGFNLHSIGNILCIIGIVIAIFGLFNPWYQISYGVSGEGITETFQTGGMIDLLKFDGINGLQVTIPGSSGPIPMGSFVLPFSLFIAIGLIFLIIATIGIPLSKKLGSKYIWRGIRLIIPFILILIAIMAIGSVIPTSPVEASAGTNYAQDILSSISNSPFGGQSSTYITIEGSIGGEVNVQWGLGLGGWLLLIAGIIIILAGILEFISKTQFFATKIPLKGQMPRGMKISLPQQTRPLPKKPKNSKKGKDKKKAIFCTECGVQLEENATFCVKCGKKVDK